MLCDHLEGWDREGGREEDTRGKRYGNKGVVFFLILADLGIFFSLHKLNLLMIEPTLKEGTKIYYFQYIL